MSIIKMMYKISMSKFYKLYIFKHYFSLSYLAAVNSNKCSNSLVGE